MPEWTDNDLSPRKLFDVLEACDGIQGDKMVYDQVRASRPTRLLSVAGALFTDGVPLLQKHRYFLQPRFGGSL